MAKVYPKFDQKISDMIGTAEMQKQKTRFGVVASYDKDTNTAKVMIENRYSDQMTDVVTNVSCLMIQGLQSVAPEVGARCLVGFRDNSERMPYILSFYATPHDMSPMMYNSMSDMGIPRYLI
jgi:hypothetical protein